MEDAAPQVRAPRKLDAYLTIVISLPIDLQRSCARVRADDRSGSADIGMITENPEEKSK